MTRYAQESRYLPLSGGGKDALCKHMAIEVSCETLRGLCHARILREMGRVRRVVIGKREWPGAVGRECDPLHIECAERSGREPGIVEQVLVLDLLHGNDGLYGGMSHHGELAIAPDPDIALAIGQGRMKQSNIRFDGGEEHDRIVLPERIVD